MANQDTVLHATVRTGTGKGAARQARRNGEVPGVVYGGGEDPLSINIPFDKLLTRLRKGRFLATLLTLKVDGHDDTRVICRTVQRDVVKDLPIHVDFMRLKPRSKIALYIPVEFVDHEESPGLRRGGALTVVRPEIELTVTAGDIPESVTVSLAGLDIGDGVTISDVTLPSGAKPTIARDFAIASIQPPSGLLSEEEEEAEAAEAEAEAEGEAGAEAPDGEEGEGE